MTIFVATSKRFYEEAARIVERIKACDVMVHHPYFHLDPAAVDADPDYKSRVTLQHFPEIDDCDVFYALLPGIGFRNQQSGSISGSLEAGMIRSREKKKGGEFKPREFEPRTGVREVIKILFRRF